ncbi:hypothetical protein B0G80_4186 [Paraburkholderia sp. BL6669N2]|nr:hypothetical protein B0G80_4186 [Paraburkholderia sp. BL6669N2]TDY25562.1 hypothetical protein B0G81_6041 [Paraburkholderia sp. BL6665CI2N2]
MAKRMIWVPGDLINVKLRENLYTIGQMAVSPVIQFYDIFNSDGIWRDVDLNVIDPLFRVFVGNVVNRNLSQGKIKDASVVARIEPSDHLWIKPYTLTMDGFHYKGDKHSFPFLGGKLIDLGPNGDTGVTLGKAVREDLTLPRDRELIEKYELTNMWGDEDLSDRLCRYFDTGINRDDLKFEVFPGLWEDRMSLRPLTRRLPVPFR